jgi:hypothetical protein
MSSFKPQTDNPKRCIICGHTLSEHAFCVLCPVSAPQPGGDSQELKETK